MMDDYDFGGDWGDYGSTDYSYSYPGSGVNVGAYPAGGGTMNLSPSDPASAYYTGPGSGYNQSGNQGLQGLEYEMAPGTGMYDVGQGWQGINTGQPPDAYYMDSFGRQYSGPVYNQSSLYPGNYGAGGYSGESLFGNTFGSPSTSRQPSRQPTDPSQGARNVAQQTPQMIALGQPEDDLYKRYKSLLMNPDFSGDPTYQFLYNQGLQSLNRNLAARRLNFSGKSMNDTMAYGSGMASKYMQDLLPQYRGGAQEELQRFMGPASLLPRYAGSNNATIGGANQLVNSADDRAMYADMLAGGNMGGGVSAPQDWGSGIGYGGRTSGYTAAPPAPTGYAPRPLSYSAPESYDYTDAADNLYDPLEV